MNAKTMSLIEQIAEDAINDVMQVSRHGRATAKARLIIAISELP